jgi:hypothetical protein
LPTKIRLGWKVLPGANTLAYYAQLKLTAIKIFITLAPGFVLSAEVCPWEVPWKKTPVATRVVVLVLAPWAEGQL